jgi:spermidine synthase
MFALSGAAALIYEIVWFQLLQLIVGSTAISVGVILAAFMGGLCLGSFLLPRIAGPGLHPLRVLALLEFGTAVLGIAVLFIMPYVREVYAAVGGYGSWSIAWRGLVSGVCLLPPALLMGGTLPAMARWVEATPHGASWLGVLYGANIGGGVLGSLFAGFYLLRVYDMAVATYVAAAINLSVAAIAVVAAIYCRRPQRGIAKQRTVAAGRRYNAESAPRAVYLAVAFSGFAALGAEVVWTRLLSLLLGASVYTFSIILAVFLLGLGIGSAAGSAIAKRRVDSRGAFGACQMLAAAAVAWSAYMLIQQLPYWPIGTPLTGNPWSSFQVDLFRSAWAILPAACFWGASFPLALASIAERDHDAGRLAGNVYTANTAGAIAGALTFGFAFAQLGAQRAQQALLGVSAAAGLFIFLTNGGAFRRKARAWAALVSASGVLVLLSWTIAPVPSDLIGYGRFTARTLSTRDPVTGATFKPNFLYTAEGLNASVAVSQTSAGQRNFHVSGKIEASTEPRDMRLQRMLGHLSALSHPRPRSVLVVGFGAGITAGTFVTYPDIERIVICEIEPLIPSIVAKYFAAQNGHVAEDSRVEIVYDDARHFLLTTHEKFDVITSDPIHPWVKGAATLYSREYLELARAHLNPGGVISQWVPLYQSSVEVVKSALATFFEVFRDGTVWSNDAGGRGYDVVLLGRESNAPLDLDELDHRLELPVYGRVAQSLNEVGFASAIDMFARFAASGTDLGPWLAGAEINRDLNLRLQYLAGMSMQLDEGDDIHRSMLAYRRFPERFFSGSEDRLREVRLAIGRPSGRMLNQLQASAILNALRERPQRISISAVIDDEEAFRYATQLGQIISAAGWEVEGVNRSVFSEQIRGMLISVGSDPPPAAANELFRALRAAGLTAEGSLNPKIGSSQVLLFVGAKQ